LQSVSGLKNVHKVVNKYNGNIDIHFEDEVFYVTIIIPESAEI